MKNIQMENHDSISRYDDIGISDRKNWIRVILTGVLLLTASSASAGIIFVPVSGSYTAPELAQVSIHEFDDGNIGIQTVGLIGEWSSGDAGISSGYGVPASPRESLPFDQQLNLVIDIMTGAVSGYSWVKSSGDGVIKGFERSYTAKLDVRGYASCVPLNGSECGQLIVDLELRGVMADSSDPSIVGKLEMVMLGSMIWGGHASSGIWSSGLGSGVWGDFIGSGVWGSNIGAGVWANGISSGVWGDPVGSGIWGSGTGSGIWGGGVGGGVWGGAAGSGIWGDSLGSGVWGGVPGTGIWGDTIGSGVWGNGSGTGIWGAMAANVSIGGNVQFMTSLTGMSCGDCVQK